LEEVARVPWQAYGCGMGRGTQSVTSAAGIASRRRGAGARRIVPMVGSSGLEPVALPQPAFGQPERVAGATYNQEALVRAQKYFAQMRRDPVVELVPEPENPHDSCAVAVYTVGEKVGYLTREDAAVFAPLLDALTARGQVGTCRASFQEVKQKDWMTALFMVVPDYDDSDRLVRSA
jgi:hypothetical protein